MITIQQSRNAISQLLSAEIPSMDKLSINWSDPTVEHEMIAFMCDLLNEYCEHTGSKVVMTCSGTGEVQFQLNYLHVVKEV